MSTAVPSRESTLKATKSGSDYRADSLAVGMIVMVLMTGLGRGIGFIRGMAFCRLMDDTDVGRWSMAFGFITLITPVMLLGIPGALPRFTEHFRVRGQLNLFVRRIGLGTLACTAIFVTVMLSRPDWFGWIVFLQPQQADLIQAVAGAVVAMIGYNFVSDLCGSLRLVRVVSMMQFVQGVGFTVLSVLWLSGGGSFNGVVWMFATACFLAAMVGVGTLRVSWASAQIVPSPRAGASTDVSETTLDELSGLGAMIRRLAPYAAALWLMNLIGNLFELSDRYMILHFMPFASSLDNFGRELAGQAAVGQYHSGRIIPMLLLSLGMMISGILLPYLATDWEHKRTEQIQRRVRDALMIVAVLFTAGGAIAILMGPWIFGTLLQGRYSEGLAVMPMALCFCTWSALVTIGQTYLWTVEKGKWVPVAMSFGLACNLVLNAVLLPRMGLPGAVLATLCSHAVVMTGVWLAMIRCGYRPDAGLLLLTLLPLTLLVSPALAIALSVLVGCSQWQHLDRRLHQGMVMRPQ
jgi:polysaccharide transporter, PST family